MPKPYIHKPKVVLDHGAVQDIRSIEIGRFTQIEDTGLQKVHIRDELYEHLDGFAWNSGLPEQRHCPREKLFEDFEDFVVSIPESFKPFHIVVTERDDNIIKATKVRLAVGQCV